MTKVKMGLYNEWNWKREQSRVPVRNPAKWNRQSPTMQGGGGDLSGF